MTFCDPLSLSWAIIKQGKLQFKQLQKVQKVQPPGLNLSWRNWKQLFQVDSFFTLRVRMKKKQTKNKSSLVGFGTLGGLCNQRRAADFFHCRPHRFGNTIFIFATVTISICFHATWFTACVPYKIRLNRQSCKSFSASSDVCSIVAAGRHCTFGTLPFQLQEWHLWLVRSARLAWRPKHAKLPVHCGWHRNWKVCHWLSNFESTIRKVELPQHKTGSPWADWWLPTTLQLHSSALHALYLQGV